MGELSSILHPPNPDIEQAEYAASRRSVYRLRDRLSNQELEILSRSYPTLTLKEVERGVRCITKAGQPMVCPKKGDWYISGAIPEAYRAPNDLPTPSHLGYLVVVEEVKFLRILKKGASHYDGSDDGTT